MQTDIVNLKKLGQEQQSIEDELIQMRLIKGM